ncbi:MAG: YceI family protein [Planctomycetota bacterium]|jgi:polyisoprenoid-binding protein YceI
MTTTLRLGLAAALTAGSLAFAAGLAPSPVAPVPAAPAPLEPSTFTVDTVHSSMVFKIRHMGVANFMGRFNEISGSYVFDPDDPSSASFDLRIPVTSVDSNSERRDRHLKSPDFFNVAEHPEMTFRSKSVKAHGEDLLRVSGDLTMHGVTKQLSVDMHLIGIGDTAQGFKSGFETTFTVKRSDFSMDTYVAEGGLGDEVQVTVCLEGLRK